jgi:hypothetical protein
MNVRTIILPMLFLVTGLIYWRSFSSASSARLPFSLPLNTVWGRPHSNMTDVAVRMLAKKDSTATSDAGNSSHRLSAWDPYFIHVNDFRLILIPASKSQPEQRGIIWP